MMIKLCEECEDPIEESRLKAFPNIRRCHACQEEAEKSGRYRKHKMEIYQELKGWTNDGINTRFIKGDE